MRVADTFARDHLPPQSEWPEFLFDRPEYRYPHQLNCVTELLDRQVDSGHRKRPALTALIDLPFSFIADLFFWALPREAGR